MKVTVKTMDAGSREFELDDEATVETLKKQIADKMDIPLDKQRLIFHGKVLKDDKPLKEYGVDGMVVHLVKSAPPPAAPDDPINQPRRRIVTSSVRQDDDNTITLEATQDMLFMSNEGLPSEGDIAQMTQNIVSQIVGALSSHGASGTVSAEATATDNDGKTHFMSATASTQKPDEITTEETVEKSKEGVAKTPKDTPKTDDTAKSEAMKPKADKTTPTAPPPSSEPGRGSVAAATGQEEEVKSKHTEKKSEAAPPPRRSLIEFEEEDPEELDRMEQERIQRSMKNLYSHARTVRRCLQYATKVLDRYDKSQERIAKKKADDDAKRAAGISLEQEVMVDLRQALLADRRRAREEERKAEQETMEVSEDDPFAILHSGRLEFIPSQLYLKFKDELDLVESRAQPIVREFRRLVEENQNLNDDELVQAQRVAITVKDFNYYIGHAYVALGRLDVQLDRPAPRHLRLYAPRRTEMRRIFQQLRSMPPQPPSGYIIDIQREGEGGARGGAGGGAQGQGRSTRAMISRGPAAMFGGLGGLGGGAGVGAALSGQSRSGGLEELVNRTSGPEFKAKLDEVRKDQDERRKKALEEAEKESKDETDISDKKSEAPPSDATPDVATTTDSTAATTEPKTDEAKKLDLKEEEEMDTSEQIDEVKPMEEDKPAPSDEGGASAEGGATGGSGSGGTEGGGATKGEKEAGGDGEKKDESGEKKEEGEGGGGGDDSETPQYLARLLSELITGMVAPGTEGAPNDAIHDVEKKGGGASGTTGGGASTGTSGDSATAGKDSAEGGEESTAKPEASGGGEDSATGTDTAESQEEPKRMSFAERYAGPEGTTVTIKAAPQMPSFPGLPPMDGPSVSIRNPGGGKPPEAVVNFPMPPAFQLLRMMLRRAQLREQQEEEAAAKGESVEGSASGTTAEGEKEEAKPKKPRLVLPPKQKEKPFVDDDGDLSSVSDAGSIDSIDSDDEGPKNEDILFGNVSLRGIGEHRSMHDAMAELRDHFGDAYDEEEEEEMGMVEMLLKAISHQISVIEVMSVFQGNTDPLSKLQQPLLNFLEDKVLYGATPTPEKKEVAVRNFLTHCQSSIRAVEHRVPLRDRGIDFPRTVYKVLAEIFEEGYVYITKKYSTRSALTFARSLKYWATRSSARFGGVVRHCLDGNGSEFEETIKLLMSTLFPPTTPPLILTMCSSSILKEIRRLKDSYHFTPPHMEKYLVWKEGAKPTPNRSYPLNQFMNNYIMYHNDTPLPVIQKESVPVEEGGAAVGGASVGGAQPLDTSELQTIQSPEMLERMLTKAFNMVGAKPTKEGKTTEDYIRELKKDKSLVSSLVEDFYYSIRDFAEKHPDYDPEKYPNIHNYYKATKRPEKKKDDDKSSAAKPDEGKKSTEATKTSEGATGSTSSDTKTGQECASSSSSAAMEDKSSDSKN